MLEQKNEDLLQMLTDQEHSFRMLALHFLSEGYAQDERLLTQVFDGWDRWGADQAYSEFPLVSYLPIPSNQVPECCRRAVEMVQGRKLTDMTTRSAGKLLEQVTRLPADQLRTHLEDLEAAQVTSKIFFRVDLSGLRQRMDILDASADQLAQRLDSSIESLSLDTTSATAFGDGLRALESLRRGHPDYMDLAALLARSPPDDGPGAVSFQLTMHSLIEFEQAGLETSLAKHLLDSREAIHTNATEALVRSGTAQAANAFVEAFPSGQLSNQRWIARGLQRIRTEGLAEKIARLRATVAEPTVWLMLLVAEVRQLDVRSIPRLVLDLGQVQVFSGALMDALSVYARVFEAQEGTRDLQKAFMTYLQQANRAIEARLIQQKGLRGEV